MAHPVTPHVMKSPQHLAAAVNTAAGHTVVDKWGILDPLLAERQINAYSGLNAFRKTGPLDRGINDPHWTPDGLATACGIPVS